MQKITTQFSASLLDADDPAEVTLVADAVGVGKTHRLATGQIITWTADFLRKKAHSLVGQPVNADLDEDGNATGHSRRVVGAITEATFDEARQVIRVTASLWRHYQPDVVARLKQIGTKLACSMEFVPTAELIDNGDGSVSPVAGRFSGLGIVRVGADPKNKVILVAADRTATEKMIDAALDRVLARSAPDRAFAAYNAVLASPTSTDEERKAARAALQPSIDTVVARAIRAAGLEATQ